MELAGLRSSLSCNGGVTNEGQSLMMLSMTVADRGTGVVACGTTGLNEGRTADHTTRGVPTPQLLEDVDGVADDARAGITEHAFDRGHTEDSSLNLGVLAFGRSPGTAVVAERVAVSTELDCSGSAMLAIAAPLVLFPLAFCTRALSSWPQGGSPRFTAATSASVSSSVSCTTAPGNTPVEPSASAAVRSTVSSMADRSGARLSENCLTAGASACGNSLSSSAKACTAIVSTKARASKTTLLRSPEFGADFSLATRCKQSSSWSGILTMLSASSKACSGSRWSRCHFTRSVSCVRRVCRASKLAASSSFGTL
mmetsp:Transcript_67296/g.130033  ORF Transcript_67296/g.130033 Transcript_67296/m.130033 type:complete len:312 (+) Transcript_67296:184-1119(+)